MHYMFSTDNKLHIPLFCFVLVHKKLVRKYSAKVAVFCGDAPINTILFLTAGTVLMPRRETRRGYSIIVVKTNGCTN